MSDWWMVGDWRWVVQRVGSCAPIITTGCLPVPISSFLPFPLGQIFLTFTFVFRLSTGLFFLSFSFLFFFFDAQCQQSRSGKDAVSTVIHLPCLQQLNNFPCISVEKVKQATTHASTQESHTPQASCPYVCLPLTGPTSGRFHQRESLRFAIVRT
ncbi:hypothetical protein BZA05DRAFT_21837 [Tricharina praecox]|uniref:uncharacterized protein n=1 Tax=Tricharina praecox TaxID=43433 RepID=UPI0022204380|nr:uncharacterized protein BZA05DRAFT_21837 [Tricharina praecox]KAI5859116.1 hypothetical protein BZA05DRAFT_21837 [Tricharina praecox]